MRILLDSRFEEQLAKQPEHGMGWQRVDIRFEDGRELKGVIVLDGKEADFPDWFADAKIISVEVV